MSNGGLRGIRVATNTGVDVSTTYYFNDAQTTATTAIQYAWNPPASPDHLWVPQPRNGTVQTMTRLDVPTPGYTHRDQVPAGLVATPTNDTAPTIDDLTGGPLLPETEDLTLGFDVRDDHQVRTAELTLATDVGDPVTKSLRFESPDRFVYTIPSVDLYGKQWVDYTLEVSDGTHTTTLGPVRVDLADGPRPPVRLNHADGDFVSGGTPITATADGDPSSLALSVDGQQVGDVVPVAGGRASLRLRGDQHGRVLPQRCEDRRRGADGLRRGLLRAHRDRRGGRAPREGGPGTSRSRSGSTPGPRHGPSPTPTRTTTTGSPSTPGSPCPTGASCGR